MMILDLEKRNLKAIIKITAELIKNGKVIVCPTDTVYGLLCDAKNKKAVGKLFKIKKRSKAKPVPIFVKDIKSAKKLAKINKTQEKFLKSVWPGKVTAILERKNAKLKLYGVEKKTIALRIPKYKLVNILFKKINLPLSGTSANISGKPATTKIKEVLEQFKNQGFKPNFVISAGNLKSSKPSKVVDLTGISPKILRE